MNARGRSLLLPGIVTVVAVGTIVSGALTPRDMSMGESAMEVARDSDLLSFGLSRLFTAAALALSVAGIGAALYRGGPFRPGFPVWASYLVYALLNFLLPGLAGDVPGLEVRYFYAVLVITAVYFSRPMATEHLATLSKMVLGAFIYGSIVASVLMPDHTLAPEYGGLIPGLDVRLYGIGGGATSLGPQAAAYLAMEAVSPTRSRTRVLHVLAASFVLVLAQSKTAWVFVLLGGSYLVYRAVARWLFADTGADAKRRAMATGALLSSVAFLACMGVWLIIRFSDQADLAVLQGEGQNLQTFTGRTYIWDSSLRVWLDNPVFGYGVRMWLDEGFRAEHGQFAHSHNQFIHALGSAGLLGLTGLLVYVVAVCAAAVRAAKTDPMPIVLLALVLLLSITEVPLLNYRLLDPFFLLHLLLFAFVIQEAHRREDRNPSP